jgi:hypothetical protein
MTYSIIGFSSSFPRALDDHGVVTCRLRALEVTETSSVCSESIFRQNKHIFDCMFQSERPSAAYMKLKVLAPTRIILEKLANHEILCHVCNSKLHYLIHIIPKLISVLSQINSIHSFLFNFCNIHFNNICTPRFPKWPTL